MAQSTLFRMWVIIATPYHQRYFTPAIFLNFREGSFFVNRLFSKRFLEWRFAFHSFLRMTFRFPIVSLDETPFSYRFLAEVPLSNHLFEFTAYKVKRSENISWIKNWKSSSFLFSLYFYTYFACLTPLFLPYYIKKKIQKLNRPNHHNDQHYKQFIVKT